MPFTISHAAAALPIHALSKRLPLAALMVGSMTPDFLYFFPVDRGDLDGHSLQGLFLFCIPAGLSVWLYFVMLLERPTLAFLPDAWRTRIAPTALTTRSIAWATLAVFIGAVTHIVWDFFTHSSQPLVQALPGIHDSYVDLFGPRLPVHFALQVISSVFGLLVLAIWAKRIPNRPRKPKDDCVPAFTPVVHDFERFLAVMFIAASACAVAFLYALIHGDMSRGELVFVLLIGGMMGCAVGWSILAVAVRFRSQALRWFAQTRSD